MPKLSINLTESNYQRLLERKGRSGASLSWQINDLLESVFRHIDKADHLWLLSLQSNCASKLDPDPLAASIQNSLDREEGDVSPDH